MIIDEVSDRAVADTRATAEQAEILNDLAIDLIRKLFVKLEEQVVDEVAAKHGGFRPKLFSTDAEFVTGGDVAKRSALQIDKQVTPLVSAFGWETHIDWDSATWSAPMSATDQMPSCRRGRKRAQQPILRWRASEPGLLELTSFDGAVEMIACRQQLLMRLFELGARRTGMGNAKTREISTLGLSMIRAAGNGTGVNE